MHPPIRPPAPASPPPRRADRLITWLAAGWLGLAPPVLAQSAPAAPAATGAASPLVTETGPERGARLYARHCSVCHGDAGRGSMWASANLQPPPRDFTSAQAGIELSRERMLAAVAAGRPGSAMPGFGQRLGADDIDRVVDFIRGRFMTLPASADMTLALPDGLQARAELGQRLYEANCVACHGLRGDGQGPRAYFIRKPPRNFLSEESRRLFNRPALFAAISAGRTGTEMPAWRQVLTPQEISHITEYVFRNFIRADTGGSSNSGAASAP
jgi:mono/diheme cytochrome c family protein